MSVYSGRMALTIAVLNQKGGVGKSTTTVMLAIGLARNGHTVEVWDTDPQGTATDWIETAQEGGAVLPFTFDSKNRRQIARAHKETTADVVLIDTPPGDAGVQNEVAALASLVIVPTAPKVADMSRTWESVGNLGGAPTVVLVTLANKRTRNYAATLDALDANDVPRFEGTIAAREKYADAMGTLPDDLGEYADVVTEIEEMIANAD